MLKNTLIALLAVATLAIAGCGGDGTTDDGGTGDDLAGTKLQSGTYTASNIVKMTDGCGFTLEDGTFTTTQVTNVQNMLSVGKKYDDTTNPIWNPAGYGEGSGPYTTPTTATLTVTTHAKITDDGCEFDVARSSDIVFVGNNAITVDFTAAETNHNTKCLVANGEVITDCTSHYTFKLSM
jgi:hypothetical protein